VNIICDLDGTIALDHKRAHHLHKDPRCFKVKDPSMDCTCATIHPRDWKSYFDACDTDEPNYSAITLLAAMSILNHKIYILSGRSSEVLEKTIAWLRRYKVDYDYIQLRGTDTREDDHIMKLRWAETLNLTPKNTLFVLEDRNRVVQAWRAKGFTCFQVADGNF
jgi:beta-phosphoglucomutase-like phosphatase (HAD superfamily)